MDEISFCNSYNKRNNLTFLSLNIQSINSKFSEFQELINNLLIHKCSTEIIFLQEIWQIQNVHSLSLSSYSTFNFKSRVNNVQGGGVGIYFKDNLRYNILPELSVFIDRVVETIFAEVWAQNGKKSIVASIYRPNSNHPTLTSAEQFQQFLELFSNIMNNFADQKNPVYLLGDFNLDALKYNVSNQVTDYIDLLFSFGFIQLILHPTRCTPTSASLIDHILTNSTNSIFDSVILTSKISDHFPLILFLKDLKIKRKPMSISYRNFSEESINTFKGAISSVNWNVLNDLDTVQERYDSFSDTFSTFFNISFPLLQKTVNKNNFSHNPWMTKGLLVSRLNKIKLCKKALAFPVEPNITNYKKFRNLYSTTIRASKKLYFQSSLKKYQTDSKKTWEVLRKAINNKQKKSNSIQQIIVEGLTISDTKIIAQNFNNFFSKVADDIVQSINPPSPPLLESVPANNSHKFSFSNNPITREDIIEAISLLKNKNTPD